MSELLIAQEVEPSKGLWMLLCSWAIAIDERLEERRRAQLWGRPCTDYCAPVATPLGECSQRPPPVQQVAWLHLGARPSLPAVPSMSGVLFSAAVCDRLHKADGQVRACHLLDGRFAGSCRRMASALSGWQGYRGLGEALSRHADRRICDPAGHQLTGKGSGQRLPCHWDTTARGLVPGHVSWLCNRSERIWSRLMVKAVGRGKARVLWVPLTSPDPSRRRCYHSPCLLVWLLASWLDHGELTGSQVTAGSASVYPSSRRVRLADRRWAGRPGQLSSLAAAALPCLSRTGQRPLWPA